MSGSILNFLELNYLNFQKLFILSKIYQNQAALASSDNHRSLLQQKLNESQRPRPMSARLENDIVKNNEMKILKTDLQAAACIE